MNTLTEGNDTLGNELVTVAIPLKTAVRLQLMLTADVASAEKTSDKVMKDSRMKFPRKRAVIDLLSQKIETYSAAVRALRVGMAAVGQSNNNIPE